MKKIKILRIIARLNIGGPAIHTVLLTEGLNKDKFDSLLVYGSIGRCEGNMYYYASGKNIKTYYIPELRRKINPIYDLIAFIKIYNLIRTEKPQIIHTHTAKAGMLGRLAGIVYNCLEPKRKAKILHTFHGHIFEGYFNKFKTKTFILIERFLIFFTIKIITVSESVKKELIDLNICLGEKIEVIPLGLELEKFFNLPFRDNTVLNIGIIGRLVPIKNHRLFLEAAAKVIADSSKMQLRFKIIGDGELKQELEEFARKLNISNYVDFLGWQSNLAKIYSDLDIVALTSRNEGTPVSLIEAMASGRVVVATDVGGVKDLLGEESPESLHLGQSFKVLERGIIVKSCDSNSFSSALSYILHDNRLRENIAFRARAFVRERFTKERLIRDIEILYDRILNFKTPSFS